MPDEPTALVNSDIAPANADVPVVVVPAEQPPEPEIEEEVDLVAEMVARGSIEREEFHDETMEALEQCLSQIANLTASIHSLSQTQTAENPMIAEMQRQLVEVKALQESLLQSMESQRSTRNSTLSGAEPSGSPKPESPTADIPQVEPSEAKVESEPPKPRRRFRKL